MVLIPRNDGLWRIEGLAQPWNIGLLGPLMGLNSVISH
jgi:hypothetical protein